MNQQDITRSKNSCSSKVIDHTHQACSTWTTKGIGRNIQVRRNVVPPLCNSLASCFTRFCHDSKCSVLQ